MSYPGDEIDRAVEGGMRGDDIDVLRGLAYVGTGQWVPMSARDLGAHRRLIDAWLVAVETTEIASPTSTGTISMWVWRITDKGLRALRGK